MNIVNDVIVVLVTASHQVENLDVADLEKTIDLAVQLIRRHRAEQGIPDGQNADAVMRLERFATDADRLSRDEWQRVLREAAEMLRDLQPTVDPQPALATHRPDGGDGGNY